MAAGGKPYRRLPSEYWATNCYAGISPFMPGQPGSTAWGPGTTSRWKGSTSAATTRCSASTTHTRRRSSRRCWSRRGAGGDPHVTEDDAEGALRERGRAYHFDLVALQPHVDRAGFELDALAATGCAAARPCGRALRTCSRRENAPIGCLSVRREMSGTAAPVAKGPGAPRGWSSCATRSKPKGPRATGPSSCGRGRPRRSPTARTRAQSPRTTATSRAGGSASTPTRNLRTGPVRTRSPDVPGVRHRPRHDGSRALRSPRARPRPAHGARPGGAGRRRRKPRRECERRRGFWLASSRLMADNLR